MFHVTSWLTTLKKSNCFKSRKSQAGSTWNGLKSLSFKNDRESVAEKSSPKAFLDDSNLFQMLIGFNDCRFWQSNYCEDDMTLECFNMIQSDAKFLGSMLQMLWWSPVNLDKVPTTDVILGHVPVCSHCLAFPILPNLLILNPTFSKFPFFSVPLSGVF